MKTEDNYPLNVGDKVWIRSNILDPRVQPTLSEVGKILDNKIEFTKPDNGGYVGAKLTSVFHKFENAFWNIETLRATNVFTETELLELFKFQ
jgi:hypothetical protein